MLNHPEKHDVDDLYYGLDSVRVLQQLEKIGKFTFCDLYLVRDKA